MLNVSVYWANPLHYRVISMLLVGYGPLSSKLSCHLTLQSPCMVQASLLVEKRIHIYIAQSSEIWQLNDLIVMIFRNSRETMSWSVIAEMLGTELGKEFHAMLSPFNATRLGQSRERLFSPVKMLPFRTGQESLFCILTTVVNTTSLRIFCLILLCVCVNCNIIVNQQIHYDL